MSEQAQRPSDEAILVAMAAGGRSDYWADEVRAYLVRLGYRVTSQQVSSWLRRMAREEMPLVECLPQKFPPNQYRISRFGWTYLGNNWRGLRR